MTTNLTQFILSEIDKLTYENGNITPTEISELFMGLNGEELCEFIKDFGVLYDDINLLNIASAYLSVINFSNL